MRAVTSSNGAVVGKFRNCSRYSWKIGYFDNFMAKDAAMYELLIINSFKSLTLNPI